MIEENKAALLMWGTSCSPLVVDDGIIVSTGAHRREGPHVFGLLIKRTRGRDRHGGYSPASYASPVLATVNGQRQIIIVNANDVMGHNAETGEIVWHFDWAGDQPIKVPQPIVIGPDRVFISSGYGVGCKLLKVLPNKNREELILELWSSRSEAEVHEPHRARRLRLRFRRRHGERASTWKRANANGKGAATATAKSCWSTTCCWCKARRAKSRSSRRRPRGITNSRGFRP